MEEGIESVFLQFEDTKVECDKKLLIQNSDYFSAMFTGNFKERFLNTVKIQDVDLKSFKTTLSLIKDADHIIAEDELPNILHAACILQFEAIKNLCIDRLEELLKPSNCLDIWKTTELLGISPLWIKAKCMALMYFDRIKDNNQLFEFTLDDICSYLGNLYLHNKSEFSVFQTAMNWWYENQSAHKTEETQTLLRLLNCIDFRRLSINEISEMQTYPDLSSNSDILLLLKVLGELVLDRPLDGYEWKITNYASHLFTSQGRKTLEVPCVLFQEMGPRAHSLINSAKSKSVGYFRLNKKSKLARNSSDGARTDVTGFLTGIYDSESEQFRPHFEIDKAKMKDLAGFKLSLYKEFVVLFGGEFVIGAGNWNQGLWVYNTFKEKWQQKTTLPWGRRHFEAAIVDGCLYIVGGAGKFRIIQDNIMWYDFEDDKWSKLVTLPSSSRHIKCCAFHGQLFLVYLTEKRGYFFNKTTRLWQEVNIQLDTPTIRDIGEYAVFVHSDYLYIKGNWHTIKFTLEQDQLIESERIPLVTIPYIIEEISCTVVNNVVYSFFKRYDQCGSTRYTLEALNLETNVPRIILDDMEADEDFFSCDNRVFLLGFSPRLFSGLNYYLARKDACLRDDIFK